MGSSIRSKTKAMNAVIIADRKRLLVINLEIEMDPRITKTQLNPMIKGTLNNFVPKVEP